MRKFPYKTWLLAGLLLLTPGAVYAAGLGKLNVLSSLGQPLQAEIDLIAVEKDELSSMTARLASPEAYTEANIPYSSALVGVRVSIEKRADGTPYIRISSIRAVNDPFIDFLIELNWAQGKLVRQYTALIDPPGFTLPGVAAPPMTVAPPAAAPAEAKPIEAAPAAAPEVVAPAVTAPTAPPAPAEAGAAKPEEAAKTEAAKTTGETRPEAAKAEAAPAPVAKTAPSEYTVKRGDTLYKIANSIKPEGVTVEQMLVNLYRGNPDAFVGNMNRLKSGKILHTQEQEQVAEVTQAAALKEIRMQTASWNAYRKTLAEAAGATPAQEEEKAAASGKITAKVEEQAAAGKAPHEVLKLSKGETAGKAGKPASPQERVHALEEEATAREKTLADANDRITQLEKQIKDMQHLLELKGVKVPPPAVPMQPAPVKGAMPAEAPKAKPAAAPAAAAVPAQGATPATVAAPPPPKPAPKKPKVVTPPPGLLDRILSQPLYLAAAGGALVLLGGIGYWVTRRRQSADKGGKAGARSAPRLDKTTGTAMEAAAPAVPAAMTQTVTTPAATADDVDPIQEADLYLNFGRDTQAEEVLKEALEKNPRHEEAQLKLLQIYAGRKDKAEFEKTARMLKELTGGKGDNWLKTVALGYSIDPANALYAEGKSAAPAAAAPAAAVDLDFDIDVASHSPAKADVELEAGPTQTALLQPGVAAQAEIEDITNDSGATGGNNLVTDITFEAPIKEESTKTDIALESGAAPGNMIDFSLDASPIGGDKGFSPDKTMAMNIGGQEKKTGGMDLDVGEAKEAAPLAPDLKLDFGDAMTTPPPALKLDDINLNLDEAAPAKPEGGGKDEHWFDVQTKFDLAKAYQEMGDKDGAREILQEVAKEGDAGQQEEARKLLESLG